MSSLWDLLDEKKEPQKEVKTVLDVKEVKVKKTTKKTTKIEPTKQAIEEKVLSFDEQLEANTNPAITNVAQYLLSRDDVKSKLNNPKKSLNKMWGYITKMAKEQIVPAPIKGQAVGNSATGRGVSGSVMVEDDVVYGWAVHYYDEENVN